MGLQHKNKQNPNLNKNGETKMKENEFIEELDKLDWEKGLVNEVYWSLDDDQNVVLDEEGIRKDIDEKIEQLKDILGVEE